jgi:hypothetical protein
MKQSSQKSKTLLKSNAKTDFRIFSNRKGIVDVQFNWIFILIAGFVIFLFIIGIVFSQKKNADAQAGISAINQITTILKSKQQTANVYSEVSIPQNEITFRCDAEYTTIPGDSSSYASDGYFTFKVGSAERVQLPNEIIFAPLSLNSNKLQVWTGQFEIGFPIGIFTYVTTPQSIILIYDPKNTNGDYSDESKKLFSDIPSNITHKLINNVDEYPTYSRRKIICFNNQCPNNNELPKEVDYINILPATHSNNMYDYGTITFYKANSWTGNEKTVPYIGAASLYGAIFSDNAEFYECQMARAIKQYNIKEQLVENRLLLMQTNLEDGTRCKDIIDITLEYTIEKQMQDAYFEYKTLTNLYTASKELDVRNTDLILGSCPKIY